MNMTEFEIVRDFKAARKKREQIGILAELNQCSREKIREILLKNGISEDALPAKPGRRRAAETEPEKIQKPVMEPEEKPEEILPMEELPEYPSTALKAEPTMTGGTGCVLSVPETVKQLCRDRIWGIIQEIAELEREKRELQKFLGEDVGV